MKSDSSTSSQESEDSDLESKNQIKEIGNLYVNQAQDGRIYDPLGIAPSIPSGLKKGGNKSIKILILDASGPATTTSTPTKSTPSNSEKKTIHQPTLGESIQRKYQTSISFVQDFHANRFRLQEKGKVSRRLVERFSSRYAELR